MFILSFIRINHLSNATQSYVVEAIRSVSYLMKDLLHNDKNRPTMVSCAVILHAVDSMDRKIDLLTAVHEYGGGFGVNFELGAINHERPKLL